MEPTQPLGRQRLSLTLSGDLVEVANAPCLNLSHACEGGLEAAVATKRTRRLLAEMRPPFDWYNAKVERDGLLLAQYRQF